MIALLIVAHGDLGDSLIASVQHVLGNRPKALESIDLTACEEPEQMLALTEAMLGSMDDNDGVLMLTDIFGATPCNTVRHMLQTSCVEAVAGVNLPMLLKALTYRERPLHEVVLKAIEGGHEGIFEIPQEYDAGA